MKALHKQIETLAWATKRGGRVRTTGLGLIANQIVPDVIGCVESASRQWQPQFSEQAAASGKVFFVGLDSESAVIFQIKDGIAEPVHCGNAVCASCAAFSRITDKTSVALRVHQFGVPVSIDASVAHTKTFSTVRTVWNLPARSIVVEGFSSPTTAWARVCGVNDYTIRFVDSLPSELPFQRSCLEKICFVEHNDAVPRVRIASCGRWHGALPQTGAIALALARNALPFVADAIPENKVIHPAGAEELPTCSSDLDTIHARIPETQIIFAQPKLI